MALPPPIAWTTCRGRQWPGSGGSRGALQVHGLEGSSTPHRSGCGTASRKRGRWTRWCGPWSTSWTATTTPVSASSCRQQRRLPPPCRAADSERRGRTPWEVRERAGEYLVRFDMPGMARDDVRVSVQDRTLVVVAEKKQQPAAAGVVEKQEAEEAAGGDYEEGDEEEEAWPAASFGRYRTRVELPENVDVERIGAEVRDGVLYLTIPKLSAGGKVVNIQVH
ncbi:unnamed protein product [Miscanthus lutarioriparius]|uniref:SHSP domain-containing protein n=1 Tax=Miscanthus lutarioriparius TaxID=422564 RepID=A0A811PFF7_9POAL|nr:unnamed protein product [Miscanthus lutarioriparius]